MKNVDNQGSRHNRPSRIAGSARRGIQGSALVLAAFAASCGGGGGSSSSGVTGGNFELLTVGGMLPGVQNAWKLNRPIEFVFSSPVDLASINSSSIQIRTAGGQQALGEFSAKVLPDGSPDPTTVVFQPRCPTASDFSDAGLDLATSYTVLIVGQDAGGIAVQDTSGRTLSTSQQRAFTTPTSTISSELFFDTKAGPPQVLVLDTQSAPEAVASFVRVGETTPIDTPFEIDAQLDPVEIDGLPVNLFSGGDQRLTVFLEFDQAVNPSSVNVSSDRLRLQFLDPLTTTWIDLPTSPVLIKNCTTSGAQIRLDPVGILPPDVELRVEVAAAFQDLIGDQNSLALNQFSRFRTAVQLDPSFNPQAVADELLESFDDTARFDTTSLTALPRADWGSGRLQASLSFETSPDPNFPDDFDVILAVNEIEVINTSGDFFQGGPGAPGPGGTTIPGSPNFTQVITNGRIYCRDLILNQGSILRFEGPNPGRIFATGRVELRGTIQGLGFDAQDQSSLQSATAIFGASGNLGGGDGGIASPSNVITQPDIKGGDGFGPNDQPLFGGRGGESGYGTLSDVNRRVGGGGGGVTNNQLITAPPQFHPGQAHSPAINQPSPTAGNNGTTIQNDNPTTGARSCVTNTSPPLGGAVGSSLFIDSTPTNNFFGVRQQNPATLLKGELSAPTAGSGGGAGGDSLRQVNFPAGFTQQNNMRGASGAGGGGLIEIKCLGVFSVIGNGRVTVAGGTGARGEQRPSDPRGVAGGSGGGSGGMIIIESATSYNFTLAATNPAVLPPQTPQLAPIFQAEGGLGGPGEAGNGNAYGSAASGLAGGGNGGHGIVQVHVSSTLVNGDIFLPGAVTQNLNSISRPNPFLCVRTFGSLSRAETKPIAVGGANLNPNSVLPQVQYDFSTLPVATGFIPATAGTIDAEAAVLSGTADSVSNANKRVVVDATALFNDPVDNVYLRNTQLMRQFEIELTQGVTTGSFTVATAQFDVLSNELTLDLEGTPDLTAFTPPGTTFELVPRFYRVRTGGVADAIGAESSVQVEFQGLQAGVGGQPGAIAVDWTTDMSDLSVSAQTIEFVKFRVTFDIDTGSNGLTGTEQLPSLDFLRFLLQF
jgi:hypothetical protein